jgi:multidrug transporter EmrE-like cation transporter
MIRWYILLAVAVLFNGIANVLMKIGMKNAPESTGAVSAIQHYLHSWPVMLGLVLFALNVIAYTQALTKIPLSIAYPIMVSLTGVIVISGSMAFFKEDISGIQWLGFALILTGVVCVAK